MKTYEEWFYEQRGCTEEQFRKWCISNLSNGFRQKYLYVDDGKGVRQIALYNTPEEETKNIIATYHRRYQEEFDREYLDQMYLSFLDWFEGYYHLTIKKFYQLCDATGCTRKEADKAMRWSHRRYMEQMELKELDATNPFKNN